MGKVALKELKGSSVFRKIAMGTWKTAKDPSVYGVLEIDMTPVLGKLEEYSKKHDTKITPAHLVGKALAFCMKRRPEINGMIRGSKIYLREDVTLFYQVNIPGKGEDKVKKATLAGTTIERAQDLNLFEISKTLKEKANKIKEGKDKEIKNNLNAFKFIPWFLTGLYLDFASFLIYGLNLNMSWLGIPKDPFGSAMITNVGGLGIDMAFAPLCPYTRVPLLLTVGQVQQKPWIVNGNVEARPILPITVTFDHRLIDGIHAAQMSQDFKRCFSEPETYLFND